MELGEGRSITRIPILYEDRSVMAIDKPAGWLLVPFSWQRTQRNLQAAVTSSIFAPAGGGALFVTAARASCGPAGQ